MKEWEKIEEALKPWTEATQKKIETYADERAKGELFLIKPIARHKIIPQINSIDFAFIRIVKSNHGWIASKAQGWCQFRNGEKKSITDISTSSSWQIFKSPSRKKVVNVAEFIIKQITSVEEL